MIAVCLTTNKLLRVFCRICGWGFSIPVSERSTAVNVPANRLISTFNVWSSWASLFVVFLNLVQTAMFSYKFMHHDDVLHEFYFDFKFDSVAAEHVQRLVHRIWQILVIQVFPCRSLAFFYVRLWCKCSNVALLHVCARLKLLTHKMDGAWYGDNSILPKLVIYTALLSMFQYVATPRASVTVLNHIGLWIFHFFLVKIFLQMHKICEKTLSKMSTFSPTLAYIIGSWDLEEWESKPCCRTSSYISTLNGLSGWRELLEAVQHNG